MRRVKPEMSAKRTAARRVCAVGTVTMAGPPSAWLMLYRDERRSSGRKVAYFCASTRCVCRWNAWRRRVQMLTRAISFFMPGCRHHILAGSSGAADKLVVLGRRNDRARRLFWRTRGLRPPVRGMGWDG